jgi:uncharacterized membrane protein
MKSKRNRIVIDFNQPHAGLRPPGSRARSRVGRILALIGIVLVIVLVGILAGAYFWWQNYKTQPAYTVALLADAGQRNDNQEIDRILDMDKIAENFVTEVRTRLTGSTVLDRILPSQVDQIVATITPKLKETLREALPAEIRRVSEPAKGKPFIMIALGVRYLVSIRQEGAAATADFRFQNEKIQLTMQEVPGGWRIVSIKDDRLAGIIADAARKGTSQRGSQMQDEVLRQLQNWKAPSPSP